LRHLRLHIETILHQSHEGIAGSGYAGRDFHRTSPTCPQIKPAAATRAGPAPLKTTPTPRPCDARTRATNRSARPRNGTSSPQLIASKAPGASGAGRRFHPACVEIDSGISGRRVCERRPSYRAPDDSARSGRRPWSAGSSPAATAVRSCSARSMTPPRDHAVR
jgi:hypothetical protein